MRPLAVLLRLFFRDTKVLGGRSANHRIQRPGVTLVEGDRIRGVGAPVEAEVAQVLDLGDATLLPGLIDSHIHFQDEPGASWVTQRAYETTALMTLLAARNARRTLLQGFTTVRDLGSSGFVDLALSKARKLKRASAQPNGLKRTRPGLAWSLPAQPSVAA